MLEESIKVCTHCSYCWAVHLPFAHQLRTLANFANNPLETPWPECLGCIKRQISLRSIWDLQWDQLVRARARWFQRIGVRRALRLHPVESPWMQRSSSAGVKLWGCTYVHVPRKCCLPRQIPHQHQHSKHWLRWRFQHCHHKMSRLKIRPRRVRVIQRKEVMCQRITWR